MMIIATDNEITPTFQWKTHSDFITKNTLMNLIVKIIHDTMTELFVILTAIASNYKNSKQVTEN